MEFYIHLSNLKYIFVRRDIFPFLNKMAETSCQFMYLNYFLDDNWFVVWDVILDALCDVLFVLVLNLSYRRFWCFLIHLIVFRKWVFPVSLKFRFCIVFLWSLIPNICAGFFNSINVLDLVLEIISKPFVRNHCFHHWFNAFI